MSTAPTLTDQWRDLAQAITFAAEDEQPHPAGPLVDRLMALVTAERMGVAMRLEQVRALRWAAEELGGALTSAGVTLQRSADDVASGKVVL